VYNDNITYIDVALTVFSTQLGTVVVSGADPIIKKGSMGLISRIDASAIETSSLAKQPLDLVAAITPGVVQSDAGQPLYFRGARAEATLIIIDGNKIIGNELHIPASAISDIAVYTGGIPAEYGDLTGGLIVITTKSYKTEMARRRIQMSNSEDEH